MKFGTDVAEGGYRFSKYFLACQSLGHDKKKAKKKLFLRPSHPKICSSSLVRSKVTKYMPMATHESTTCIALPYCMP